MIELFYANTPNGRKISIMLEEINFPYKITLVDIFNGEQFNPKFRSISPFSKKDQNNNELDTIWGKKSKGSNNPTKMLLEKSGFGKSNSPINKPIIIDIIKSPSFKLFL